MGHEPLTRALPITPPVVVPRMAATAAGATTYNPFIQERAKTDGAFTGDGKTTGEIFVASPQTRDPNMRIAENDYKTQTLYDILGFKVTLEARFEDRPEIVNKIKKNGLVGLSGEDKDAVLELLYKNFPEKAFFNKKTGEPDEDAINRFLKFTQLSENAIGRHLNLLAVSNELQKRRIQSQNDYVETLLESLKASLKFSHSGSHSG